MTMIELAKEYRQSGLLLKKRIAELRKLLAKGDLCEMEKFRLRGRIDTLASMERDMNEIAVVLEKYYDRRYKRNGRYSI
ncbi:MAG: hypothetical protein E7456_06710 [Ruminococcaceae bacterium]|nr:hypothetical protein [Oscillospiraceae bacterium]